jgi:hypothetical protein
MLSLKSQHMKNFGVSVELSGNGRLSPKSYSLHYEILRLTHKVTSDLGKN